MTHREPNPDASSGSYPALRLRGIAKHFARPAVIDLDLTVRAGEFYALLGPNGAGKTTTLRMVAGLLKPDAGSIQVFGTDLAQDPIACKQMIAWLPDEALIYDRLSPWEHLDFIAGLWSVPRAVAEDRAETLLKRLELWEQRHEQCGGFSRGMKQKVALACAMLHEPRLMILDEPLTGLDAAMARQVKDILRTRVDGGATVIMTTHILEVAERLADRIGIIHAGRLLAEGDIATLRTLAGGGHQSLEDVFLALIDRPAMDRSAKDRSTKDRPTTAAA